jgi:WD40 repeat protein
MKSIAVLLGLLLLQAQAPPSTDIFLVDVSFSKSPPTIGRPLNVTAREGYDNQPMFLPDGGSFFYTSIREGRPTDIYRYAIASRADVRMTNTTEGEYSATPTPDGKFFSVIRVEADSTQRLWKFPIGGGTPSLVLENVKPVGYHAWIDDHTLLLFVLGSPATLQLADVTTGKSQVVASNIDRSLHRIPGQNKMSFIHKVGPEEWYIKSFDPKTRQTAELIRTLPGAEDIAWTPDGAALTGKDAKLYIWNRSPGTSWQEIADFTSSALRDITRLALSPKGDRLAIVAVPVGK